LIDTYNNMKLNEYRISKKWSYGQLAMMLGVSHATVARRYCLPVSHRNYMIPNRKYMLEVVRLTQGAVQPNDFYYE